MRPASNPKTQDRQRIQASLRAYLQSGGRIKTIPAGETGHRLRRGGRNG